MCPICCCLPGQQIWVWADTPISYAGLALVCVSLVQLEFYCYLHTTTSLTLSFHRTMTLKPGFQSQGLKLWRLRGIFDDIVPRIFGSFTIACFLTKRQMGEEQLLLIPVKYWASPTSDQGVKRQGDSRVLIARGSFHPLLHCGCMWYVTHVPCELTNDRETGFDKWFQE